MEREERPVEPVEPLTEPVDVPESLDAAAIRVVQERAARALPAVHVEQAEGWWLRRFRGASWWIGSVLPHADADGAELLRRVEAAEAFHAAGGTVPRFQITPGVCPPRLDALLAARGYHRESALSLQAAPLLQDTSLPQAAPRARAGTTATSGVHIAVQVDPHHTPAWRHVWHTVLGHGAEPGDEWAMLARVSQPSAYATARLDGEVVAVGRAVADDGWAGVFGMATLPRARGHGAARAVLGALSGWARAAGADRLYLQVERDNAAALRLYARAGFREVCRYHYRTAGQHR